jgi:hypothetical protein
MAAENFPMTARAARAGVALALAAALPAVGVQAVAQSRDAGERAEMLRGLHPVCRIYYEQYSGCVSQVQPASRRQRNLDEELAALSMLSHSPAAARQCFDQLGKARQQRSLDCEWDQIPDDVLDYGRLAGFCDAARQAAPAACRSLSDDLVRLRQKYATDEKIMTLLRADAD